MEKIKQFNSILKSLAFLSFIFFFSVAGFKLVVDDPLYIYVRGNIDTDVNNGYEAFDISIGGFLDTNIEGDIDLTGDIHNNVSGYIGQY